MINERFRILKYVNTENLFHLYSSDPPQYYWADNGFGYYVNVINFDKDKIKIIFQSPSTVYFYDRYPDTLIMGLAKIGGFLALLKLGFLL
jgi:hypothetical protein